MSLVGHLLLAYSLVSAHQNSPALAAPSSEERLFVPVDVERRGALRIDLLERAAVEAASPIELRLDLTSDRFVVLDFERRATAWGGGWIWYGHVRGDENSRGDDNGRATLSVMNDVVIGSVRFGRELWAIEYAGNGLHRVRFVDEEQMPTCAGAVPVQSGAVNPNAHSSLAMGSNTTPVFDILVAYTPQARFDEGGTGAIEAKINLAVAESNQAYANSQVVPRLNLVHQYEATGYIETGDFSTELGRLWNPVDGYLDSATTLREQYCADFVVLIVAGTQYCGIGYLMSPPGSWFSEYAFSVTSRTCATGYYTFAHELGHNMGCEHDRANATLGLSPAYSYSYGYHTPDNVWRTIMAYAPGTRLQFFSNPNVSYAGQPLGVADPAPDSAENWKTINNTAALCEQFRGPCPGSWTNYCTAGTTANGCNASISATGIPSASASSGYVISVAFLEGQKQGILFYGVSGRTALPWATGSSSYLCVALPTQRMGTQSTNGTLWFCNGALSKDWNAFRAANPTALGAPFTTGDSVQTQAWFRDPASPKTTSLSDALEFVVAP